MLGTAISIVSVSLLALQSAQISSHAITGLVQALISALLMNISIVGTNQLFDVDIDKINKPYLPLASGEFSMGTGIAIVVGTTLLSLVLGWVSGSVPLMATLVVSWILGILYSTELPFMRWKRSPFLAASCILAVRAIIVQLGFYTHMVISAAGGPSSIVAASPEALLSSITHPVIFTVAFMLFFSIVIALFKDIPDVKGDDKAGVRTLTVRMGVPTVFWTCIWLLTAAYTGAVAYSLLLGPPSPVKVALSCMGHVAMAALLWKEARGVNLKKKQEISDCYFFIWKLFYAEYLIIPFLA